MSYDDLFNSRRFELVCGCGKPAPYIFVAELDDSGQPVPTSTAKWAICKEAQCCFRVDWEYHDQAYRNQLMRELPQLQRMQNGEFEHVYLHGNDNRIGNNLALNFHYRFTFRDLQHHSALIPPINPAIFDFPTILENSTRIPIQGVQEAFWQRMFEYLYNQLRL